MKNRLFVSVFSLVALALSSGCSVPPAVKEAREHEVQCTDCRKACEQLPSSPKVYSVEAVNAAKAFIEQCEAIMRRDPNCKLPKECVDEVEEQKKDAQGIADGIAAGDLDLSDLLVQSSDY